MNTPFDYIYQVFLRKISDFTVLDLDDDDVRQWCFGFMMSALVKFKPVENDIGYDLAKEEFTSELLPLEIELIAIQMVAEWVEPQLFNTTLVKQFIGTKDERFFAQANQIEKLQSMMEMQENRRKKLRRDYKYDHFDPSKVGV